jgi:LuxR family maltose regulon positive regulatory protein
MAVAGPRSEPAVVAHSRHGRLPAARGLVPRRPLFDRLSRVGPGEVVLLCAPAGSGKTALLRSWMESEGLADRVAWVSVERAERDAQRFWLSVVDELAGAVVEDGRVERVGATPAFGGRRSSSGCWPTWARWRTLIGLASLPWSL